MGLGAQNAAMMGLNPKARISQMGKAFQDYAQAQSGIDMQMANLKYGAANQMAMALPGWSTGQQQSYGQVNQVGGGQYIPGSPGKYAGLGQAMGGIGGMMFGQGLGNIGSGAGNFSSAGPMASSASINPGSGYNAGGMGVGQGNYLSGYQPMMGGYTLGGGY